MLEGMLEFKFSVAREVAKSVIVLNLHFTLWLVFIVLLLFFITTLLCSFSRCVP